MGSLTKYVSNDRPEFAVLIEDEDKVHYAYLWKEKRIVGDIWLYNSAPTPAQNTPKFWERSGDIKNKSPFKRIIGDLF